jgi:hypothetical protein
MKSRNEVNKDEIIKEYGEDFYNALDKTAKGINDIFRKSNSKDNDFAKRMYEKLDKLREEEKNKNN